MAKVTFHPVPPQTDLQSRIPAGRQAVSPKPFSLPTPAFGPGSVEHVRKQAEELDLLNDGPNEPSSSLNSPPKGSYAGAGSYF
jgi:hypothetical protein